MPHNSRHTKAESAVDTVPSFNYLSKNLGVMTSNSWEKTLTTRCLGKFLFLNSTLANVIIHSICLHNSHFSVNEVDSHQFRTIDNSATVQTQSCHFDWTSLLMNFYVFFRLLDRGLTDMRHSGSTLPRLRSCFILCSCTAYSLTLPTTQSQCNSLHKLTAK